MMPRTPRGLPGILRDARDALRSTRQTGLVRHLSASFAAAALRVAVVAALALVLAGCGGAGTADETAFDRSQLVQLGDLPPGWERYEVPDDAGPASTTQCGTPLSEDLPAPVATLAAAWSEKGEEPSIAGERLERYESETDVVDRREALMADALPCEAELEGGVITTVAEMPIDLGSDGPDAQVITRTYGPVPEWVPGPAGFKHQYQVKLYRGREVVALVLDVANEDRPLIEDLATKAWTRYASPN